MATHASGSRWYFIYYSGAKCVSAKPTLLIAITVFLECILLFTRMGMVLLDHIFIGTVAAVTLLALTHVHKPSKFVKEVTH